MPVLFAFASSFFFSLARVLEGYVSTSRLKKNSGHVVLYFMAQYVGGFVFVPDGHGDNSPMARLGGMHDMGCH